MEGMPTKYPRFERAVVIAYMAAEVARMCDDLDTGLIARALIRERTDLDENTKTRALDMITAATPKPAH